MSQLEGTRFDFEDEEYYVIKREGGIRFSKGPTSWWFFMYDVIMGDLQHVGTVRASMSLDEAVAFFKSNNGELA